MGSWASPSTADEPAGQYDSLSMASSSSDGSPSLWSRVLKGSLSSGKKRRSAAGNERRSPLPPMRNARSDPIDIAVNLEGHRHDNKFVKGVRRVIAQQRLLGRMRQFNSLPGAAPGIDTKRARYDALAERFHAPADVTAVEYNVDNMHIHRALDRESMLAFIRKPRPDADDTVRWINVDGLNWTILSELAETYNLHPLALEDMMHVPQRPKADFYDGCIYICILALWLRRHKYFRARLQGANMEGGESELHIADAGAAHSKSWGNFLKGEVAVQQCSMFLLEGHTLLTVFLADSRLVTGPILDELQLHRTLLCDSEDASFLMYRVIDVIVDHLAPIADEYNDILDDYEQQVMKDQPTASSTTVIYAQQRELVQLSRILSPVHSVISNLVSRDAQNDSMLSRLTAVYLNDTIDNIDTAAEVLLGLADESRDLRDLMFSLTAHRQSMATQTLAVMSSLFLPITFIAGVYGTNFETIPELSWHYGYVYFWVLCVFITVAFSAGLYKLGMFKQYN
mmetsp:Transcript_18747/g.33472  ORF Transcript_18747/g.33472 Transcript_18747/m.33472 type:complete len:511 (-) Transcript_18747:466-1998(-)